MNDLTFRMEIVKSMEDHLKHDLENIRRYDPAHEPPTVKPQGLTQGFENEANMLSVFTINCKCVDELSHKMPTFMSGIGLRNASQNGELGIGGVLE
jgi:hypothetical protein